MVIQGRGRSGKDGIKGIQDMILIIIIMEDHQGTTMMMIQQGFGVGLNLSLYGGEIRRKSICWMKMIFEDNEGDSATKEGEDVIDSASDVSQVVSMPCLWP